MVTLSYIISVMIISFFCLFFANCQFQELTNFKHDETDILIESMQDAMIKFIENFFEYELIGDCNIDSYIDSIYVNSFMLDNPLGDYTGCLKSQKNMTYLFFLYIRNETIMNNENSTVHEINFDEGLSFYFKDLIYRKYYSFSMCVPKCFKFKETSKVNPFNNETEVNQTFLLKIYDTKEIYSNFVSHDITISYIIYYTYISSLAFCLFFALFPTMENLNNTVKTIFECSFCCCRKKEIFRNSNLNEENRSRENEFNNQSSDESQITNQLVRQIMSQNQMRNPSESEINDNTERTIDEVNENNDDNSVENSAAQSEENQGSNLILVSNNSVDIPLNNGNSCSSLYRSISSILSLSKNFKRVFKDTTSSKNKISSSYVNDNSISFLNGLKGINLLLLTYCTIFWIFIESPNTLTEYEVKEKIFYENIIILPLLYYLYFSIYLTFAFNGFSLGYKFLCHMNSNSEEMYRKKFTLKYVLKRLGTFILPQLFRYPLLIFLMLSVHSIQNIMNLGNNQSTEHRTYGSGPFFYIYKEISNYTIERIQYFLLLYANFMMTDRKLTKISIYVIFFFFINEVQYFFLLIIVLVIYYYKPNIGSLILILLYFLSVLIRAVYLIFSEEDNIGSYGDIRDFFGFEIFSFHFAYGLPVYILGVFFGVLYYEYNVIDTNTIRESILTETFIPADGQANLNYSDFLNMANYNNKGRFIMKSLFSSKWAQLNAILIFLSIFIFFILYDNLVLFKEVRIYGFIKHKFNNWEKFYSFLEVDFVTILIFLFVFRYAIFSNRKLKKVLESKIWIPFSRLYFVISSLLSPITYYFVLNLEYPLHFIYANVLFLSLSILFSLFILGFFISLFVEVPLKVGFKKIVNKLITSQ